MLKKIFSYLSVLFFSITGASAKPTLSSAEFEARQNAELHERLLAEEDGETLFCGQCDDSLSQPIVIAEQNQPDPTDE